MNRICISIILLLCVLTISSKSYGQDTFSSSEDLYFGLKPPGMVAQPLALDIMSKEGWELGGMHAPDMNEFYFISSAGMPLGPVVVSFRKENSVWKKYNFFSSAGNIMYQKDKYIERTDSGWSEIKSLGAPFEDIAIMRLTASLKGTLVFDFMEREGNGYISYSRLIDGKREKPQKMSKALNVGKWTAHPFIAPDESYLLWDVETDSGYGGSEIYISFRAQDGSWLPAMNMGDTINTEHQESSPHVSPDGKYLFFSRSESKVREDGSTYWVVNSYWVDAQVIETLRPE